MGNSAVNPKDIDIKIGQLKDDIVAFLNENISEKVQRDVHSAVNPKDIDIKIGQLKDDIVAFLNENISEKVQRDVHSAVNPKDIDIKIGQLKDDIVAFLNENISEKVQRDAHSAVIIIGEVSAIITAYNDMVANLSKAQVKSIADFFGDKGQTQWRDLINNINSTITELERTGDVISNYIKIFTTPSNGSMSATEQMADWMNDTKRVTAAVNKYIFGTRGVFAQITGLLKSITVTSDSIYADIEGVRNNLSGLSVFTDPQNGLLPTTIAVVGNVSDILERSNISSMKINDQIITELVDKLNVVLSMVKTLMSSEWPNPMSLYIKLLQIRIDTAIITSGLMDTLTNLDGLGTAVDMTKVQSYSENLEKTLVNINNILSLVLEFNFVPRKLIRAQMKRVKKTSDEIVLGIIDLHDTISVLGDDTIAFDQKIVDNITNLNTILGLLIGSCKQIVKLSLFILPAVVAMKALNLLPQVFAALIKAIDVIAQTKQISDAKKNIDAIKGIIESIIVICVTLVMMVPMLALFALAAPGIILGIMIFAIICNVISKVVTFIIRSKFVVTLVDMAIVLLVMCAVVAEIIALAALSKVALPGLPVVGLMLLGVAALLLALAGIGLIAAELSAFIAAGIIAVTAAAVSLLVITLALWAIQSIQLNPDKIKENVGTILDTAKFIIASLFESEVDSYNSSDNKFLGMMSAIGGGLAKFVSALAASVILTATVVSVIGITLIAATLLILQEINLNPGKIKENVQAVIGTANDIINAIFGTPDDVKTEKSNKGTLLSIINWVSPQIGQVIKAALGAAYLALMFISVGMILAIASMLRMLQELDLKQDKIMNNIESVFSVTQAIIDKLYGNADDSSQTSSQGILVGIINWVDPAIGKVVQAALGVAYLALTLISIGLILAIVGMLKLLEAIEFNADDIQQKVSGVFDTVDGLISRVLADRSDKSKPASGWLGKLIRFFSPGLTNIVDALMAVMTLGLTFMAVSIVCGIAKMLTTINNIDFDKTTITTKVNDIFNSSQYVINKVMSDEIKIPERKNKSNWAKLVSFFNPIPTEISDLMTAMRPLQAAMAAMGALGNTAQNLQSIQESMKDVDMSAIRETINNVITIANDIARQVFGEESKFTFLEPKTDSAAKVNPIIDFFYGPLVRKIARNEAESQAVVDAMKRIESLSMINGAIGSLQNIATGVKDIDDIKIENFTRARTRVAHVLNLAGEIASTIFSSESKIQLPEPDPQYQSIIDGLIEYGWASSSVAQLKSQQAASQIKEAQKRIQALGFVASALGSLSNIMDNVVKINDFKSPTDVQARVKELMDSAMEVSMYIFSGQFGKFKVPGADKNAVLSDAPLKRIQSIVQYVKTGVDGTNQVVTVMNGLHTDTNWKQSDTTRIVDDVITFNQKISELVAGTTYSAEGIKTTQRSIQAGVEALKSSISQMNDLSFTDNGENVRNNCDLMNTISSTIGSFVKVTGEDVKNSEAITENYIQFFKTVDNMDLRKLQHTDYLMRSWASISRDIQGNFEGLAKTIEEHIMPMLDKLNETMDNATDCQKQIIDELTQPVDIVGGGSSLGGASYSTPSSGSSSYSGGGTGGSGSDGTLPRVGGSQAGSSSTSRSQTGTTEHGRGQRPSRNVISKEPDIQPGKYYKVSFAEIKDA